VKKLFILLFAAIFMFALVACGNGEEATSDYEPEVEETEESGSEDEYEEATEEELISEDEYEEAIEDVSIDSGAELLRTVVFVEDGTTLSLGDERVLFEETLGAGVEGDEGMVSFLDGTFTVRFRDDIAVTFVAVAFLRIEFPAFDVDRSISQLTQELMFDPFFEHPNAERTYVRGFEIDGQVYAFQVTLALTSGELSGVESISVIVLD